MLVHGGNDPQDVFDKHFSLKCPRCGIPSNITVISIPRYEYLIRFQPKKIGMVYRCDNCGEPVFLRFNRDYHDLLIGRPGIEPQTKVV